MQHARALERGGFHAGCLIAAIAVILVFAVGGYLLVDTGLELVAEQVKADIRDHPVILEHIGNIESIEMDLAATAVVDGDEVFVFALEGTKSKGELTATVKTVDDDTEKVIAGSLRLPSGETHDLFPESAPPAPSPN